MLTARPKLKKLPKSRSAFLLKLEHKSNLNMGLRPNLLAKKSFLGHSQTQSVIPSSIKYNPPISSSRGVKELKELRFIKENFENRKELQRYQSEFRGEDFSHSVYNLKGIGQRKEERHGIDRSSLPNLKGRRAISTSLRKGIQGNQSPDSPRSPRMKRRRALLLEEEEINKTRSKSLLGNTITVYARDQNEKRIKEKQMLLLVKPRDNQRAHQEEMAIKAYSKQFHELYRSVSLMVKRNLITNSRTIKELSQPYKEETCKLLESDYGYFRIKTEGKEIPLTIYSNAMEGKFIGYISQSTEKPSPRTCEAYFKKDTFHFQPKGSFTFQSPLVYLAYYAVIDSTIIFSYRFGIKLETKFNYVGRSFKGEVARVEKTLELLRTDQFFRQDYIKQADLIKLDKLKEKLRNNPHSENYVRLNKTQILDSDELMDTVRKISQKRDQKMEDARAKKEFTEKLILGANIIKQNRADIMGHRKVLIGEIWNKRKRMLKAEKDWITFIHLRIVLFKIYKRFERERSSKWTDIIRHLRSIRIARRMRAAITHIHPDPNVRILKDLIFTAKFQSILREDMYKEICMDRLKTFFSDIYHTQALGAKFETTLEKIQVVQEFMYEYIQRKKKRIENLKHYWNMIAKVYLEIGFGARMSKAKNIASTYNGIGNKYRDFPVDLKEQAIKKYYFGIEAEFAKKMRKFWKQYDAASPAVKWVAQAIMKMNSNRDLEKEFGIHCEVEADKMKKTISRAYNLKLERRKSKITPKRILSIKKPAPNNLFSVLTKRGMVCPNFTYLLSYTQFEEKVIKPALRPIERSMSKISESLS